MHYDLSAMYNKPSLIACCSCYIAEGLTEELWDEKIKDI